MGEKIHLGLWISVGAFFIYHWGKNTAKNKVRTLLMDFEDARRTIHSQHPFGTDRDTALAALTTDFIQSLYRATKQL